MKRIKRKLIGDHHSPVNVDIDVPDGLTHAAQSLNKVEREKFWNAAIDDVCKVLTPTDNDWLATVPMCGGLGSMHLESRHLLGRDYLHAVSPWQRAYVTLRMLGKDRTGVDSDHWYAKEFRLAAARWFDAFDVMSDGVNLAAVIVPSQRWTILLAAQLDLAYQHVGTVKNQYAVPELYETAAQRCRESKTAITLVAPSTWQGQANTSELANQWSTANEALASAGHAPEMLARLTLRVLSQRLFIELPDQDVRSKRFFAQWMEVLEREPDGPDVIKCLRQLRQFGGIEPLDPGPEYPEIFRPYRGWSAPPLEDFEHLVAKGQSDKVVTAYRHAVEVVDRLMDLLLAKARPRAKGAGFDSFAYGYLRGRMNTTRNEWNLDEVKASQRGSFQDRVQFQRLLVELSRSDERTIKRAADAWRDAASSTRTRPQTA